MVCGHFNCYVHSNALIQVVTQVLSMNIVSSSRMNVFLHEINHAVVKGVFFSGQSNIRNQHTLSVTRKKKIDHEPGVSRSVDSKTAL